MTATAPAGTRTGADRVILALACLGSFLVILDATIVSVALPRIRADLELSTSSMSWIVNAYTLTFAGFLLFGGRCADVFGRRRMLLVGVAVFTLARFAAGLATTSAVLMAARAVQGVGAALLMPVTLSLLTVTFVEPARRVRALGLWSAVGAVGGASGPILGGVLTQWLGWRWVFWVTVPLGALAMIAAARVLPARRGPGRGRLDLVGATIATVGLVGVVYAVSRFRVAGPTSAPVLVSAVGGLVLLVIFCVHQFRHSRDPLLAADVVRLRSVAVGNLVMFLVGLGFFASPILLSLSMQEVLRFSAFQAGLGFLPVGAAMFAGARLAGPVTTRFGPRTTAVWCATVGAVGFLAFGALDRLADGYVLTVVVPGVLLAFGTAAAFTPVTVAATCGVPAARQGMAAGLLNTTRQTSGAIGLAALSVLASAAGYPAAFVVSGCCLILAAVVAAVALPGDDHATG